MREQSPATQLITSDGPATGPAPGAGPATATGPGNDVLERTKQKSDYRGFVAGVFSGIAKLSGTAPMLYTIKRDTNNCSQLVIRVYRLPATSRTSSHAG